MKYMMLVRGDDSGDPAAAKPVEPWVEEQGADGVRLHGHRLRPSAEAVTVRVRDGEVLRTDGPFAETKEYVGGFDVLECADLDEAVRVAARHPGAAAGFVEVRALWDEEDAGTEIRRLDADLAEALRERDVERLLSCYAPDAEVFHSGTGRALRGADALRELWESEFARTTGPVGRETREFRVHADESIALGHALVRVDATRTDGTPLEEVVRVTTGYRNIGLRWVIVHEHVSVAVEGRP
ncbi:nuclear transport factor 2 family protein [Streptomyces sp. YU58]|uniref:nuclear transport factor 2 family protein n=1 Tax=Streptomyces sp. SX92 TaxID=3158972 RepID=UPI0027BABAB0|nr:nuclear transport factor 2 family protein [Streptomyces coralus]WLW57500.1 nuclear transport factor 2 family protein [Streptomyces coralus]